MEKGKVPDDIKVNIEVQGTPDKAIGLSRSTKILQLFLLTVLVISSFVLYQNLQLRGQLNLIRNDVLSVQRTNNFLIAEIQWLRNEEQTLDGKVTSIQSEVRAVQDDIDQLKRPGLSDTGSTQKPIIEVHEETGSGDDNDGDDDENDYDDEDEVSGGDFYLNEIDEVGKHDYELKDDRPLRDRINKAVEPLPVYIQTKGKSAETPLKRDTDLRVRPVQDSSAILSAAHFEAVRVPAKYHISSDSAPEILPIWQDINISNSRSFDGLELNSSTGIVTVRKTGIYFVYAQLAYHDLNTRWTFGIFVNGTERIRCATTKQHLSQASQESPLYLDDLSPPSASQGVYQQCYTASLLYIRSNDEISIRSVHGLATIVMQSKLTFWGLMKFN